MQAVAVTKSKLTTWIELAAALSVLFGLLFVALEIRQNNEHARADSVRDLFQMWSDIYEFEYEHGIPVLVTKSIERPGELTEEDFLRLSNYLDLVMNAYLTQAVMQQQAGLVVGDVVARGSEIAELYFQSIASRLWLRNNTDYVQSYSPDLYSALIDEIEKSPVATEMPLLKRFRHYNRQNLPQSK
jgi:hypothetical protein